MGRAARWFRNLLGLKKTSDPSSSSSQRSAPVKEKRRWSFVRSHQEPPLAIIDRAADRLSEKDRHATGVRHTVAMSAADRVTGGGGHGREVMSSVGMGCRKKRGLDGMESAVIVIQSAFRGYLARRALRALKGLVKIQALVRGYIVRKKRTSEWLSQMQALLRAQARARKGRAHISMSSQSSSKCYLFTQQNPGPVTPEKMETMYRVKSTVRDQSPVLRKSGSSSKLSQNWSDGDVDRKLWEKKGTSLGIGRSGENDRGDKMLWEKQGTSLGSSRSGENDRGDKILEVNSRNTRRGNIVPTPCHLQRTSRSFTASRDSSFSEVQSAAYPVGCLRDDVEEEGEFLTANNSPQFYTASATNQNSRRSPFTPSKSEDSRSYFGGDSYYPNYMSYTESSRAKVRSASAPKQRPQFEKSGSVKRNSMHGFGESRSASQKSATVFASFAKKGYPGSGRLDRYGLPVRGDLLDDYWGVDSRAY